MLLSQGKENMSGILLPSHAIMWQASKCASVAEAWDTKDQFSWEQI